MRASNSDDGTWHDRRRDHGRGHGSGRHRHRSDERHLPCRGPLRPDRVPPQELQRRPVRGGRRARALAIPDQAAPPPRGSAARAVPQGGRGGSPRLDARRQPDGRRPRPARVRAAPRGRGRSPHEARLPDRRRAHRDPPPERGAPERPRAVLQRLDEHGTRIPCASATAAAGARGHRRLSSGGPHHNDRSDTRSPPPPRERREQQVVDARRDVLRAVHDHARQHGRERRAAVYPARPARLAGGARVDRQRVHADVRGAARHRRAPRRHLRAPADVPVRRGRVRPVQPRDRVRTQRHHPRRLPRRPGRRCRVHDARHAVDHHPGVPGRAARNRDRDLGRGQRAGARDRPCDRWLPHRVRELASDLLHQPADRRRRDRRDAVRRPRVARRNRRQDR